MDFRQTFEFITCVPPWHSILLKGIHGLGKSALVKTIAEKLNGFFCDQRLSQKDVGDLTGLPFFVKGRCVYAPPEFFPLRPEDARDLAEKLEIEEVAHCDQDVGIMLFDEIDRATRQVQQAAFELALDRRLNMKSIPDLVRVVSCINGDSDIYHTMDMGPAFIDRWVWINAKFKVDEWLDYARGTQSFDGINNIPRDIGKKMYEFKGKVHPAVIQFISTQPDMLDPKKEMLEAIAQNNPNNPKQPSRRSWTYLSEMLFAYELLKKEGIINRNILEKNNGNMEYLKMATAAYVGTNASDLFVNFIENNYKLLSADAILNRWDQDVEEILSDMIKKDRLSEIANLSKLVSYYISENKLKEFNSTQADNFYKYMKILPREIRSSVWKSLSSQNRDLTDKWYGKNKDNTNIILDSYTKFKKK